MPYMRVYNNVDFDSGRGYPPEERMFYNRFPWDRISFTFKFTDQLLVENLRVYRLYVVII